MEASRKLTGGAVHPPTRNQHTIASPCSVSGRGYWSGNDVHVTILPAAVNVGVQLVRTDLPDHPVCAATTDCTGAVSFRTNLANGPATFSMVEHLLAALAGLEIDNCFVEIDAEELPGLDGSSLAFVDALQSAGLVIQAAPRSRLVITETLRLRHHDAWVEVLPATAGESYFEYQLNYGDDSPIPAGDFGIDLTPHRFIHQVAPARTFVTTEQAAALQVGGVAAHVTPNDLIVFGDQGPVGTKLRFRDECSRHKTLDLIGDLSLAGCDIVGRVISHRGGHVLNGMLAGRLRELAAETFATNERPRKVA